MYTIVYFVFNKTLNGVLFVHSYSIRSDSSSFFIYVKLSKERNSSINLITGRLTSREQEKPGQRMRRTDLVFFFISSVNIPQEWKAVVVAAAVSRAVGSDHRWTIFVVAGAAAVACCGGGRPREVVVPR